MAAPLKSADLPSQDPLSHDALPDDALPDDALSSSNPGDTSKAARGDSGRSIVDRLTGKGYKVVQRNDSAYALLEGPLSWRQARREARRLGGDLVTINGPGENDFITRRFEPLAADDCGLWIGLNAIRKSGRFEWSDGSESRYRHWVKAGVPGYRTGLPFDDPSKPFVHIYFNQAARGFWKNADNTYHDVMISGGIAEFSL